MYDTDGVRFVEAKEVETFIKDIYGREFLTNQNVQQYVNAHHQWPF
jgi:hypothetical protein